MYMIYKIFFHLLQPYELIWNRSQQIVKPAAI